VRAVVESEVADADDNDDDKPKAGGGDSVATLTAPPLALIAPMSAVLTKVSELEAAEAAAAARAL
jgi:hypothetical protein